MQRSRTARGADLGDDRALAHRAAHAVDDEGGQRGVLEDHLRRARPPCSDRTDALRPRRRPPPPPSARRARSRRRAARRSPSGTGVPATLTIRIWPGWSFALARVTSLRHSAGSADGSPTETAHVTAPGSSLRGAGSATDGSPSRQWIRLGCGKAGAGRGAHGLVGEQAVAEPRIGLDPSGIGQGARRRCRAGSRRGGRRADAPVSARSLRGRGGSFGGCAAFHANDRSRR